MKFRIGTPISSLSTVLGVVDNSASAGTEQRCEQQRKVLQYLSYEYLEKPVVMDVAENGGLNEVLTSHKGVTLTTILTSPEGETCMVAAGEDWAFTLARCSSRRSLPVADATFPRTAPLLKAVPHGFPVLRPSPH